MRHSCFSTQQNCHHTHLIKQTYRTHHTAATHLPSLYLSINVYIVLLSDVVICTLKFFILILLEFIHKSVVIPVTVQ